MADLQVMPCPKADQETGINWLREDDLVEISSSDRTFWTQMKSKGWEPYYSDGIYLRWKIPKAALSFRSRSSVEAPPSEKQKEAWANSIKRLHKSSK